jgi:hypothetical protein
MQQRQLSALFVFTVLWGALIYWIAPHPPMIDLPAHAGQVTLLRDILLADSPWSDRFRLNLLTPYVLGYGLALPLSLVMPVAFAFKLLLSLGFIAFIYMCVKLRQHFNADSRLDWLFVPGYFGFAYSWGFLTFLLAAPLGLAFIWLSARCAARPTAARSAGVVALGLAVLASHGLMFLFVWGVGSLQAIATTRRLKTRLIRLLPYTLLLFAFAGYFLVSRQVHAGLEGGLDNVTQWAWGWPRRNVPAFAAGGGGQTGMGLLFLAVFFVMVTTPWLMGLRIEWRRNAVWIPFFGVAFILAWVPHIALDTVFLYQRFALFLLPAYAWLFASQTAQDAPSAPQIGPAQTKLNRHVSASVLLVVTVWTVLGLHTVWALRFARESADFDAVMRAMEPRQRALSLIFDRGSAAVRNDLLYLHFGVWYQVEKQGLVDFNFAWFPPQIVRFRTDRLPAVRPLFEWKPESFNWAQHRGGDYRYFLVRHDEPVPAALFSGAACAPQVLVAEGRWTVFEQRACP